MKHSILLTLLAASVAGHYHTADKGGEFGEQAPDFDDLESGGTAVAEIPDGTDPAPAPQLEPWVHPRERDAADLRVPLKISDIIRTAGTQSRVTLDAATITDYAEVVKNAVSNNEEIPLPPVVVFREPAGKIYLADGFHRTEGHEQAGETEILADIIDGTLRDAILYSVGANSDHGLPRKNADKQRAVKTLLADVEWSQWSNNEIARMANVSESTVREFRKASQTPADGTRKAVRGGKEVVVKVGNIGKGKKATKDPAPAPEAEQKPDATSTKPAKAPKAAKSTPEQDAADDAKLEKTVKAISKAFGEPEGEKFRKGYTTGALELSVKDMRELSDQAPAKIAKLHPLIVEKQWKPKKAIAFLDREIDGASSVDDLVNHAISRRGSFHTKQGSHIIAVMTAAEWKAFQTSQKSQPAAA